MVPRASASSVEVLLAETAARGVITKATQSAVGLLSSIKSSFISTTGSVESSLGSLKLSRQLSSYSSLGAECDWAGSERPLRLVAKRMYPPGKLLWMHRVGHGSKEHIVVRLPPSRTVFSGIILQTGMLTSHNLSGYTAGVQAWKDGA